MLPESLKEMAVPAAVEAFDAGAITGGNHEVGETLLWVRAEKLVAVCGFLKREMRFERLAGMSVIDRYPLEPRFEAFYLLHSIQRGERIKLKVAISGESPAVPSVCSVWEGANWLEREAYDMFGVAFEGHPGLKRILMPEDWVGHPLRKDFPVHGHKYSYKDE